MAIFSRPNHRLIAETPLSLLALTRHLVEPNEENWFARCRVDYLRSFPFLLVELVRLALFLTLINPFRHMIFSFLTAAGWGVIMAMQISVCRKEMAVDLDEKLALKRRYRVIQLRAVCWIGALLGGILIAPSGSQEGLVALGIVMMVIDGLAAMSLPHLGLMTSSGGAVAITISLALRDGWAASPVAIAVGLMASFLHWSLYNLYYMFATRRIRTRRLSQSNETIQLVLNQYDDEGSDWLYELDAAFGICHPSPRFCNACGLDSAELEGAPLSYIVGDTPEARNLYSFLQEGRPFRNIVLPVKVAGSERWWSVNGRPVERSNRDERRWRGFIADVTTAKQAEAKVAFMAHYDALTRLPNRSLFNTTLKRALHRNAHEGIIGLLYIDLDHFKAINDSHGHDVGDQVLVQVARLLEDVVRPRDMIARLGGDEFVVLIADLDTCAAGLAVAERVLKAIGNVIQINDQVMPIGASIGAAFAPQDGKTGDELLRAADLAMYDAKSHGRRSISLFNAEMQVQMQERRLLEFDLRVAIGRGELELHFQQLVDIVSGITAGYEALLRWNHPIRGQVPPDTFIPIAEETGVIIEIGEWVIRTALAEAATWPGELTVAVNMSPTQIKDVRTISIVVNALAMSGVNPDRLELEITENLLMQNSDEVLTMLHKLRSLGVRIALDDFGTGYSSLNYLRSFPFDKIKIDRCFVSELANREDCQTIVRSVIALAKELNMTTTAEGVEFSDQLEALRRAGCTQAQGFLYGRAKPARALQFEGAVKRKNASNQ